MPSSSLQIWPFRRESRDTPAPNLLFLLLSLSSLCLFQPPFPHSRRWILYPSADDHVRSHTFPVWLLICAPCSLSHPMSTVSLICSYHGIMKSAPLTNAQGETHWQMLYFPSFSLCFSFGLNSFFTLSGHWVLMVTVKLRLDWKVSEGRADVLQCT